MNQDLLNKLETCQDLPELPATAVQIVALARDPTATMADVARTVGAFPAANEKILRLANSPVYGGRRQNTNLRQAVTLLGINATLMITLSFAVFASLRQSRHRQLDLDLFWRRSLLAATAGRVLAYRSVKRAAEDSFLGAMVQDIGALALDAAVDGLYDDLDDTQQLDHHALVRYELQRTGSDHAEVSQWLLQRWQFPEHLCRAVAASHDPAGLARAEDQPVSRCVALAGLVADELLRDAQPPRWSDLEAHAQGYWTGDRHFLDQVFEHLATEIPVVASLFRLSLLDEQRLGELRAGTRATAEGGRPAAQAAPGPRPGRELLNRDALEQTIADELALAEEHHWPFSFVFVDVDRLKVLIDAHGNDAGNAALDMVAQRLTVLVRDSDSVGRYGGKQFVAVLPGTDGPGARIVGERIVSTIRSAELAGRTGEMVKVTVSAGLVTRNLAASFRSADEMLRAARRAAFQAGMEGGDQLVVHQHGARQSR